MAGTGLSRRIARDGLVFGGTRTAHDDGEGELARAYSEKAFGTL